MWPFSKKKKIIPESNKEMGLGMGFREISTKESNKHLKKIGAKKINIFIKKNNYYLRCPKRKRDIIVDTCINCDLCVGQDFGGDKGPESGFMYCIY